MVSCTVGVREREDASASWERMKAKKAGFTVVIIAVVINLLVVRTP